MHDNDSRLLSPRQSEHLLLKGLLGVILLSLVAFGIYGRTLHYDLIFDDLPSIVKNNSIKQLTPLFGTEESHGPLRPSPDTPLQVRPIVNLTLALNYHFGREDPWGYRLVNVVGHIIVTLMLWWVITATLSQPVFRDRFNQCKEVLGFWGALVWMVHPTHEDTVVYLTQRTELLMGLFYILAILLSIRYWKSTNWWSKLLLSMAAAIASASGMLCKEMAASVPAMVAAYEWTFVGGSLKAILRRSWLLYVSLTLSWIPIAVMYASGAGTPLAGFNNLIPAYDYWLTQSNCFFYYWRLVFCPWPLILHYHVPTLHSLAEAWPGMLGVSFYGIVTALLVSRRNVLGFVLLWFFAILSPTLIVPLPHEEIAERRLYVTLCAVLPTIAIYLMVQLPRLMNGSTSGNPLGVFCPSGIKYLALSRLPILAVVIASVAVILKTVPRLEKSTEIWTYVLKYQPDNNYATASQGMEELRRGDVESGLAKIQQAYDREPTYTFLANSLIHALDYLQEYPRMLDVCREQYELYPRNPVRVLDLAHALEKNGAALEAMEKYREVIQLLPDSWQAHSSLATLLAESGQVTEAIHHFQVACQLEPDFMNSINLLMLYLHTNQHEKATQLIPQVLEASRKENVAEEHQRIESEMRQLESQLNAPSRSQLPF